MSTDANRPTPLSTPSIANYEDPGPSVSSPQRLDWWLAASNDDPRRSYVLTRAIFLRSLGVVYLIAFVSLWVQIDGLVGSRGILPARAFLDAFANQGQSLSSMGRFFQLPTLCWINASDAFLSLLCGGGAALAGFVILGLVPAPALVLLWLFYLSLVNVGQVFLGYQWDALLLEAGFLAIFFAPLRWRLGPPLFFKPRSQSNAGLDRPNALAPSRPVLYLLRWLLFRLMLLSGLVKLTSGDPTWRNLTAMRYHYWTQPLPTWTSWYVHLAPNWFAAASTAGVFAAELLAPLLIFCPRRSRLIGCGAIVFFQLLIAVTGNYGFFNLLAIVLCVTLVDDAVWVRLGIGQKKSMPADKNVFATIDKNVAPTGTTRWMRFRAWAIVPLAIVIFILTFPPGLQWIGMSDVVPRPLFRAYVAVAPFESINGYGLFANMTTERPELIVEGSNDREHWQAYEFQWKPGDLSRRPRFCAPHMPRLDWQMWFAALELTGGQDVPWVLPFLERLHEGSPPVLKLLRKNPFPGRPPRYFRIIVYQYRFTTCSQRSASGDWWRRTRVGQTKPIELPP